MAIDYKKFFDLMNEVNAYAETNIDNNIPQDAQLALTDFRRKLQPVAEQLNVYKEKVESGNYPMEERTAAETQLTAALKELAEEAQNAMAADGPEVTKHIFSMYHDGINGVLPEPAPVQAPEIAPAEGNNAGPQLQNHEAPEPHPMYNYQAFKDAIDEVDRSANAEAHPHEPEDVHAARRDFRRDLSTATQRLRIYKDLLNRGEAYPAVEREKNKNQLAKNLAALALEAKKQIDSLDVRLQDTKLKPLEADELRFNRTLYSQYLAGLESVFPYFDIATPPWASHEVTGTAAYAKFDEVLFGRLFDKAEGVRTVGGVEEFLRSYTAARPAEIDLLNGFTAFEARLPGLKDAFRLFHTMKENDTFNNAQDLQQAQDYLIGQLGELRDSAKQLAAGITEAMKTMPPENPDYAKLGNVLSYYTACMQTVYQIDALNEVAAASNDAFTQLAGRSAAMFEAIEASGNLEDRSAHIAPELKDIYKDLLKFRETAAAKPFEETYHALEAQEAAIQERLGAWEGRKHFEDLLGELDAVSIDRLTSIKNDISIAAIQSTNKLIDKYRVSKLLKSFVDDRADKSYREFYTSICRDALSGSLGTPIDPEMVRSARKAGGVSKLRIRGQDGMFPIATAKEFSRYLENEMQAVRSLRPDEIDRFHDDNAFLIENANRIDDYIALKTIEAKKAALAKVNPEEIRIRAWDKIMAQDKGAANDLRERLAAYAKQLDGYGKFGANSDEFNRFRGALDAALKGGSLSVLNREAQNYINLKTNGNADAVPSTHDGRNRLGMARLIASLTQYNRNIMFRPSRIAQRPTVVNELRRDLQGIARELDSKSKVGANTTEYKEFRAALTKAMGETSTQKDFTDLYEKAAAYRDLKTNYDFKDIRRPRRTEVGDLRLKDALRVIELTKDYAGKRSEMTAPTDRATARIDKESWSSVTLCAQLQQRVENKALLKAQGKPMDPQDVQDLLTLYNDLKDRGLQMDPKDLQDLLDNGALQGQPQGQPQVQPQNQPQVQPQNQPQVQPQNNAPVPVPEEATKTGDQVAEFERTAARAKSTLMGGLLNTRNATVVLSEEDRELCLDVLIVNIVHDMINRAQAHPNKKIDVTSWRHDKDAATRFFERHRDELRDTFFREGKVYETDKLKELLNSSIIKMQYRGAGQQLQNRAVDNLKKNELIKSSVRNILVSYVLLNKEPGENIRKASHITAVIDGVRNDMKKPPISDIVDSISDNKEFIDSLRRIENPDKLTTALLQKYNALTNEFVARQSVNAHRSSNPNLQAGQVRQKG